MFAYNEELNIEASLRNVLKNIDTQLQNVHLMANGCTDGTVTVAKQLKTELAFDRLVIHEISLGDKCNAWNHYVHTLRPNADCHFFIDSDVRFTEQCFPKLFTRLQEATTTPNIIAGYPLSGRNVEFYQMLVEQRACFFGNLYGASQQYIEMVRDNNFCLPIGLNWIDSFLTKAANTDIQFLDHNLPDRVIYEKGIGFEFDSLSPFKIADIKLYKNRIARYELGKIQEKYLDNIDVSKWPKTMSEINLQIKSSFDRDSKHLNLLKKYLVKKRLSKLINKEQKMQ